NVLRVITQPGSVDVSALLFEEDRGSPVATAADGKEGQEILPDGCVQSEGPSQRQAYGSARQFRSQGQIWREGNPAEIFPLEILAGRWGVHEPSSGTYNGVVESDTAPAASLRAPN
ncbi:hypothetical protein FOZ62_008925, partial [Perkinsus olseni]